MAELVNCKMRPIGRDDPDIDGRLEPIQEHTQPSRRHSFTMATTHTDDTDSQDRSSEGVTLIVDPPDEIRLSRHNNPQLQAHHGQRQWTGHPGHHNPSSDFNYNQHPHHHKQDKVPTGDEVVLQVDAYPDSQCHHHADKPRTKKVSRQVSFKNARSVARQLSTNTRSVARQMSISARTVFRRKRREKPNSFFNVGVFACFCCFSPLGLIAMVLSALSDISFDDGEIGEARRRRTASLIISIVGIVITLVVAVVLLFTVAVNINA